MRKVLIAAGLLSMIVLSRVALGWEVREETLRNGMKLVLVEDHAFPLVSVVVVVNAGALYEDIFTNGLSHFLEHLVFDGTKTQSRKELADRFDGRGIYFNAFTRKDFVAFLITSPTEFIEDAVENQADMLLNSIIPKEELEKERKVVIEEMTKDRDKPEVIADEFFALNALRGTPYERPIIGYENTINTVTREEIFDFYSTYYVPNNMTAIVLGDFSPSEIVDLFERVYGQRPPRRVPSPPPIKRFLPEKNVLIRKSFNTERIYMVVGVPAPLYSDEDAPSFSLIQELLNRESSILKKALTQGERPVAQEVSCEYRTYRGLSLFVISMTLPPSSNADTALLKLTEVLRTVKKEGFKPDFIRETQRALRAEEVYNTENYTYLGMFLSYWVPLGGVGRRQEFLAKRLEITNKDLKRAMGRFWEPLNYVAVSVEPRKEKEERTRELKEEKIERVVLPNGLTVIAKEDSSSPILAVHTLIGHRLILEPKGKNGLSHFVMQMLDKGTKNLSKEELTKKMDLLGVKLKTVDNPYLPFDDYYNSKDYAYARFEVLDENKKEGIELLSEILSSPSFREEEIEQTRSKILSLIKRDLSSSRALARNNFYGMLLKGTQLANPLMGDTLTLRKIRREDLIDYHTRAFVTGNMVVAIVGNGSTKELVDLAEKATRGLREAEPQISMREAKPGEVRRKVIWVKRDQAYIYMGRLVPSISHPDAITLKVLSLVLSDRLRNELREKRGLAYRLGAGVEFLQDTGIFFIAMGTRSKMAREAERGIGEVLEGLLTDPPTPKELERNVNSYWGHYLRFHQRRINRAYYLSLYEYLGKGYEFDLSHIEEMRKVSPKEVLNAAQKYLKRDELITVIAGNVERD